MMSRDPNRSLLPETSKDGASTEVPEAISELEPEATPDPAGERGADDAGTHRPLIERIGMALIAVVLAALFAAVAVAAFAGREPFLAVMGALGCLMTLWVGAITLFRG